MKLLLSIIALLSILFFYGTYENAFGRNGYKAQQQADWWPYKYVKNCYTVEKIEEGALRWCKKDAALQIFLYKTFPEQIKIDFFVYHPDKYLNPVTVKYGGKAGAVNEIIFKDLSRKTINIPITKDNIFEFQTPSKVIVRYFVLSLDVSRTWVPKKWDVSDDTRELGVAVLIPNFRKRAQGS